MKRPLAIIITTIIIIIGLSVVQVSVSNQLSTTGTELAEIEHQIDHYKKENTQLQEEVLLASSLTNIAKKAEQKGFTPTTSFVYLTTQPQLAFNKN